MRRLVLGLTAAAALLAGGTVRAEDPSEVVKLKGTADGKVRVTMPSGGGAIVCPDVTFLASPDAAESDLGSIVIEAAPGGKVSLRSSDHVRVKKLTSRKITIHLYRAAAEQPYEVERPDLPPLPVQP